MKRSTCNVEDVRYAVTQMVGKNVNVKMCRGRGKVKRYKGVVREAYSNVFVVQVVDKIVDRISCSYADIVCGEIALKLASEGSAKTLS